MEKQPYVIHASLLYDGRSKQEDCYIIIEEGKILDVRRKALPADEEGIVTPAFIDAHSHIGMVRQGEPSDQGEVNDRSAQITPLQDPLNGIYFDDRAFQEAVDFGVLYSCVVPGSGNLLGGQAVIIRNFAANRGDAVLEYYGFKMALGYNPRKNTQWNGTRPSTRMGTYAMLEERLDSLLIRREKAETARERKLRDLELRKKDGKLPAAYEVKERKLVENEYMQEFSPEDRALLQLLSGEKTAKVHVHKEDDVLYLIGIAEKYGLRVTADHTCDVSHAEVFNALADAGIPVVYGPLGSLDYKTELKNASYRNVKQLMESRAFYGFMTDHPVILSSNLRESLKYFLIQGMPAEEAISLITWRNAKILGIDDRLGTVEPGKTASLLVWDRDPLHLAAVPRIVLAEGKKLRG